MRDGRSATLRLSAGQLDANQRGRSVSQAWRDGSADQTACRYRRTWAARIATLRRSVSGYANQPATGQGCTAHPRSALGLGCVKTVLLVVRAEDKCERDAARASKIR